MVSEKIKQMERELTDELDKYFPQSENKEKALLRSRAYCIMRRSIELGVQGHADHIRTKFNEITETEEEKKVGNDMLDELNKGDASLGADE